MKIPAEALLQHLKSSSNKALELHRELLKRTAINPEHGGEGEEKKARWIEHWLHKNGLCEIERIDAIDERVPRKLRPNIVACYKPKNCKRILWIITHMDTVASGPIDLWRSDPFILRQDGDRLYGRGVEDNNQAIVSALLLLDALKHLEPSAHPAIGLGLICVSAGLTNYTKGLNVVLEKHPKLFSNKDLIVLPGYGNEKGDIIEVSEKKSLWLRIIVDGDSHHAGYETGSNSFEAASHFICQLDTLRKEFAYPTLRYSPLVSTITPTHCETSCTGLNHVPSRFTFYLDIRLTPGCEVAPVIHALQQLATVIEIKENVKFRFETVEIAPDAPATPLDTPVIQILQDAIQKELGIQASTVGVGGTTMISVLRSLGLAVAVWSIQSGKKTKVNESISLKGQMAQTCVFARMLYYSGRVKSTPKIVFTPSLRANKMTTKELDVAKYVGQGMSNQQISDELQLSINTVRTHLKNLYGKTNAKTRSELIDLCSILIRYG